MVLDILAKLKEFQEQRVILDTAGRDSRVLLVDSMNAYIRCFAATPTMNDDGEHVGGVTGFLKSIGLAIRQFKPTRVVCIFDGAGGSQRRRKLYEGYKDKRRSMQKLNRTYDFATPEEEKAALRWQLKLLVEILEHLPVTVYAVENIEADDTIAYLTKLIKDRGGQVTILSTDKDFLQLVDSQCEVYNPIKKKMYTVNEVVDEYGIHPSNFLTYRIIEGDTSDNIPGVKGIAIKTLLKNFPEMGVMTNFSIDDILEKANDTKSIVSANVAKKLLGARDNGTLTLNKQLMDLANVDISGVTKLDICGHYDDKLNTMNKYTLTKLFTEYKLFRAFSNYDEWLVATWTPLTRYK